MAAATPLRARRRMHRGQTRPARVGHQLDTLPTYLRGATRALMNLLHMPASEAAPAVGVVALWTAAAGISGANAPQSAIAGMYILSAGPLRAGFEANIHDS
ncbi:hypothetical protein [Cupriavidus basilensis]|uniref:hypothetical protein n=1 Tax=Cupriavidus basilensis TaxID=68895 RepID=UPI003204C5E3